MVSERELISSRCEKAGGKSASALTVFVPNILDAERAFCDSVDGKPQIYIFVYSNVGKNWRRNWVIFVALDSCFSGKVYNSIVIAWYKNIASCEHDICSLCWESGPIIGSCNTYVICAII